MGVAQTWRICWWFIAFTENDETANPRGSSCEGRPHRASYAYISKEIHTEANLFLKVIFRSAKSCFRPDRIGLHKINAAPLGKFHPIVMLRSGLVKTTFYTSSFLLFRKAFWLEMCRPVRIEYLPHEKGKNKQHFRITKRTRSPSTNAIMPCLQHQKYVLFATCLHIINLKQIPIWLTFNKWFISRISISFESTSCFHAN